MPYESWTFLDSREVSNERIFRMRHDRYRFEPTAAERDFVVLDSPDWVNVVPVTGDGQVVLIRQYRHGIRQVTLEIPGGMVDPDESPREAALRELEEETGYVADRARLLGRIAPNPAILNNRCHMFLAEGCRRVADPKLDPFERIEVVLRPLAEIPEMVRSGEIFHGLVLNAFAWVVPFV